MKTLYKKLGCAALLLSTYGCNVLDIKDYSAINPDIWHSFQSATLYVNDIYTNCSPTFSLGGSNCDEVADAFSEKDRLTGNISTGSEGAFDLKTYTNIRYINIGLEEMKNSRMSSPEREYILGQLYFFRAYVHWELVKIYGGIPYSKSVADAFADINSIDLRRDKTSTCIQYIQEDLQKCINMLPNRWTSITDGNGGYGRVTKTTAAALLGRILLYYASPQYNPEKLESRWETAYRACWVADSIAKADGYKLFQIKNVIPSTNTKDLNELFLTKANDEVIWARAYLAGTFSNQHELNSRPTDPTISGRKSEPLNEPSLLLVTAFPMADGTPYVHPKSPTSKNAYRYVYKDRDPRFYSTVVYNGSLYPLGGNSSRIQFIVNKSGDHSESKNLDRIDKADERSTTGFYCRKFIDPSISVANLDKGGTDWVEIRYAEVLLNLAECAAELGRTQESKELIAMLRERVGIPQGTNYYGLNADGYTDIERVMRERQIELVFENKRYWDVRRRNMFTQDLGPSIKKLNGVKRTGEKLTISLTNNKKAADVLKFIEDNGGISACIDELYATHFDVQKTSAGISAKSFNYKTSYPIQGNDYNFFDIPTDIMQRSAALLQTKGWGDGTFDPFE